MTKPYRLDGIVGEPPATAEAVARFLEAAAGDPIEIVVNSGGGDAFEGAAIYGELAAYPGEVVVEIRGIAASAASLIVMGADRVIIDPAALFMIHDPSALTIGPPAAHREAADTLDKLADTYAEVYAARSGNSPQNVREWMVAETWLSAAEAVALGFADQVAASDGEPVARFDFSAYAQAPRDLVALAARNGWVTASPEYGPS